MERLISVSFIITMVAVFQIGCNAEVLKNNGTAGKHVSAETLVAYGREVNDSLITLIGRVIENYHVCTAWSEWSECGATLPDYFSTRTRTRRCGGKEREKYGYRDEIETGVCEGKNGNETAISCPSKYHMTTKGFCLKFYKEKRPVEDAMTVCRKDGGFLVNIDSDLKYEAVKSMLLANNITTEIHIDGKYVNSRWTFSYGSTAGYFHWYPGYPYDVSTRVWLKLSGKRPTTERSFRTFNYNVNSSFNFICEILLGP